MEPSQGPAAGITKKGLPLSKGWPHSNTDKFNDDFKFKGNFHTPFVWAVLSAGRSRNVRRGLWPERQTVKHGKL
jgi:hypothetical protein